MATKNPANMYSEAGVRYYTSEQPGFSPFRYRWTSTAKNPPVTHTDTVYCRNRSDFLKLLRHWNRFDTWIGRPVDTPLGDEYVNPE